MYIHIYTVYRRKEKAAWIGRHFYLLKEFRTPLTATMEAKKLFPVEQSTQQTKPVQTIRQ